MARCLLALYTRCAVPIPSDATPTLLYPREWKMQEFHIDTIRALVHPLLRHWSTNSQTESLFSFITRCNQQHRKAIINICRSLSIPIPDTTLYAKTQVILCYMKDELSNELQSILLELCTNPLTSGLIISLCISLPMTDAAIRQTYVAQLSKEMLVMESSPLPQAVNYECFFGDYNRPLHPTMPPNPIQAARIHRIIDSWISELEDKDIILPYMTLKLCSKHTQNMVSDLYPDYITFEEEGATQPDLETIYMRYGDILSGGACEIKQRWYTSGLVPRTYYAAGSDAYHKSKYLRDAFNRLCDLLPPTERFSRVNVRRIVLSSPESHAIVYDLTSFTSNMHEQRHFLDRLSLYCRGRRIRILDTIEGIIEEDLGVLIDRYNDLNKCPTYSSDKLLGKGVLLDHHVAGFLGVYGNLATCTFLHGAVMSCIVDSFQQMGVAGDDGIIDSYDDWMTFFAIRLLGIAEESKGYSTADQGNQVYLKRPIRQYGTRFYQESFAIYSMIEHIMPEDDRRFFPKQRSKLERKGSLASSIVSYMRSLTSIPECSEYRSEVVEFLRGIYAHAGFPESGHVPYLYTDFGDHQSKLPNVFIPSLDAVFADPVEYTIKSLYSGSVALPKRVDEVVSLDHNLLYAGSIFECTGSVWLSFYRKMGFVEIDQDEELFVGEEGLDRLLHMYLSSFSSYPLYSVTVVHDIPTQLLG